MPIGNAPKECVVESQVQGLANNAAAKQRPTNAPLAIIIEVRDIQVKFKKDKLILSALPRISTANIGSNKIISKISR